MNHLAVNADDLFSSLLELVANNDVDAFRWLLEHPEHKTRGASHPTQHPGPLLAASSPCCAARSTFGGYLAWRKVRISYASASAACIWSSSTRPSLAASS
ncbi:hypothetical protein Cni_G08964 [Canna indica]|uniref:Uncharacterized protein n=1 Tax=Canna indica TaxID=4628 RepID=A0AAQ3K754_9LILI|nr:hypothetical protein Cni_G08964 [Canna indica]